MDSIAACVAAATGAPASSIRVARRPPLEMQSNRLYDAWAGDRRLIVKEFLKPDEYQDAPRREYAALQLLVPLDVAPQPVFYRPQPTAFRPILFSKEKEAKKVMISPLRSSFTCNH